MNADALHARARELGVQTSYHDVDGALHHADDVVLQRVVATLEADRAAVSGLGRRVPPIHLAAGGPLVVAADVRQAVVQVDGSSPQDLAVRHGDDHDSIDIPLDIPLGCHDVRIETAHGVEETVLVVAPPLMPRAADLAGGSALFAPAYALWSEADPLPSLSHLHDLARRARSAGVDVVATLPLYATFLDSPFDPSPYSPISRLHLNEVYLDDAGLPAAPLPNIGAGGLVDWAQLGARRRRQLLEAVDTLDATTARQLTAFVTAHPDVGAYARFRAQRDAAGDERVERSHVFAQFLADRQLRAIRDDPSAASLALDLPIGSHPDGYERWADPTMFADGVSVGAPPDSFFSDGQSWGFPPPLPAAMHASGQRTWRQLVARAGQWARMLRIDHAMAVHRLWWVPDGCSPRDGVYVQYPRHEILAVIAATAAANDLTIVGEDLGTVPPEVSRAFAEWDMLGMYEEQFHLDDDPLPHIPARSVAGIRTHDMEPLAALLATTDTSAYRRRLGDAHGATVDDRWQDVVEHMLIRLAASDAYLVVADLDDLVGETSPHNLPGRVVEGLWSRRLARSIEATLGDPDVRRRLAILGRTPR